MFSLCKRLFSLLLVCRPCVTSEPARKWCGTRSNISMLMSIWFLCSNTERPLCNCYQGSKGWDTRKTICKSECFVWSIRAHSVVVVVTKDDGLHQRTRYSAPEYLLCKYCTSFVSCVWTAPLIIHFHLDKSVDFFIKDTHYRNRFETNTGM